MLVLLFEEALHLHLRWLGYKGRHNGGYETILGSDCGELELCSTGDPARPGCYGMPRASRLQSAGYVAMRLLS